MNVTNIHFVRYACSCDMGSFQPETLVNYSGIVNNAVRIIISRVAYMVQRTKIKLLCCSSDVLFFVPFPSNNHNGTPYGRSHTGEIRPDVCFYYECPCLRYCRDCVYIALFLFRRRILTPNSTLAGKFIFNCGNPLLVREQVSEKQPEELLIGERCRSRTINNERVERL